MALPTRPTSGQPAPRREPVPPKRESNALPSLPDIELPPEPQVRKQEPVRQSAQRAEPRQAPAQAPRKPKTTASKPKKPVVTEPVSTGSEDGWAIDPKTGKKYRKLPKTVMGNDGRPLLQIEDFNLDDLTGEAEMFLAHLRVPPDKEEQKRLRELKIQQARKQNAEYVKANPDDDEEDDEDI